MIDESKIYYYDNGNPLNNISKFQNNFVVFFLWCCLNRYNLLKNLSIDINNLNNEDEFKNKIYLIPINEQ